MKQSLAGSAAWAILITAAAAALGAAPARPRVFCLSPQTLAQAKSQAAAKDETLQPALEKLREDAQSALKAGPFSVVDNDLVPPSGDKHGGAILPIYYAGCGGRPSRRWARSVYY